MQKRFSMLHNYSAKYLTKTSMHASRPNSDGCVALVWMCLDPMYNHDASCYRTQTFSGR